MMSMLKLSFLSLLAFGIFSENAFAQTARLKDIASIRGVRENQLIGYGIVVGLKGTGDGKSDFTNKSILRMLDKLGMKVDSPDVASANVAAVILTATLPPFAKAGNPIDVTVNSIGTASSLVGGTLLQTPLRAANEQVFAVAQGALLVGDGKAAHTTVGRIPNGAMIERDVAFDFGTRKMFRMTLHNPDFTTASRAAMTINRELGGTYASAKDAGTLDIIVPFTYEGKGVELLATIESIQVNPDSKARVIINEKTGTVIIGEKVRVSKVAISHGSLSVKVGSMNPPLPSARGPASEGSFKMASNSTNVNNGSVALIESGANVGELVQSLNKLGVTPKDLITILQSIKAAGALNGELEVL